MSHPSIRSAFEDRLALWASSKTLPVFWENVSGGPINAEHLRAFLLPAPTLSNDLAGDQRRYGGVFQVSVFTPSGIGAQRAELIAHELDSVFPVTLCMVRDRLTVMVATPMSQRKAVVESDWYIIPVDCQYYASELLNQ